MTSVVIIGPVIFQGSARSLAGMFDKIEDLKSISCNPLRTFNCPIIGPVIAKIWLIWSIDRLLVLVTS